MEMATAFNNSERTVFLISLKAGGTGLNLTGASRVILYDLWWNPAVEQQAAARAHRIGQTKDVDVVRIISKGTIEENIRDLQQSKLSLVDQILPSNEQKANININELKQLLFNTDKLS
ncbi:helicase [Brochothrix thermosphacta DSM 20171 = FSL F6-1036]|nr:helicase [Brochothrix thermosphacta DSM 20171 = FSL F6-1036]